jgi:hypothetical protein
MFVTQNDHSNATSAKPLDGALTEPNPRPGSVLTLVRAVDEVPVGAQVLLVGSMFRYEEAQPTDEFEVEYRRRLITVQRCEVQTKP